MSKKESSKKQAAPGKSKARSFKQAKPGGKENTPVKGKGKGKAVQAGTPEIGKLGSVVVRNEFYRDGYRIVLKLALVEAFIIIALIAAMLFVVHVHQPENRYFATTEDGRLIPMVALSEPNLSSPALMTWVAQSATEVMTFGFNDYRRRLQESSRNFTKVGWETFTKALEQSRILETLEASQQVLTAAPQGAPILLSEGVAEGRYEWIVQIPLILTYQAGSERTGLNILVTVRVVRLPRLESPSGVGIAQWIAAPR